ncbi:hypothetical protein R1sor_021132 [Riccia sorocarpa]|uniref:OVATE domain-containing protein n=1 Tax=Riccia sorocarpa TaxID=122646 RepID=A0ABD3GJV2_9MARC
MEKGRNKGDEETDDLELTKEDDKPKAPLENGRVEARNENDADEQEIRYLLRIDGLMAPDQGISYLARVQFMAPNTNVPNCRSQRLIYPSSRGRPQRFKMSLPFLNKKKKRRQQLMRNNSVVGLMYNDPEDSEEDSEEQDIDIYRGHAIDCVQDEGSRSRNSGIRAENGDNENLTRSLVPAHLGATLQLQNIKAPPTYKTYDVHFSPSVASQSSRRKSKTSSPRGLEIIPSASGPLSAPPMTTGVGCKSWMKAKCGSGNCSKKLGHEKEGHRERQSNIDRAGSRRHSSRTKSLDPVEWESDNRRNVPAEVDYSGVKQKTKSGKLAPSPGISASDFARVTTSADGKCSMRDPYEEVREAVKHASPALDHLRALEMDCSPLLTDVDVNSAEEPRIYPWGRSFSSPSSDDELFTTSVERDGQAKQRKKWASNSSDDTEYRQHRSTRSKSMLSRDRIMTVAELEEEQQEVNVGVSQEATPKKGSRIIFLSTPPRPKILGLNDKNDEAKPGSLVKCSTDGYGDYSKLESILKERGSRSGKALTTSYKSSVPPSIFGSVLEANAKAWSKLNIGRIREGLANETGIGKLALVPRTKGHRQFDVHIEEQISNLRLDSGDTSDSSEENSYSSRGSRRHAKVPQFPNSKFFDQEKSWKKKRSSASSRRRRSRSRSKPPPLLPDDLHGRVKESVAVVKSSYDPYNDFRDSMVEMIVEKEIRGAIDLEELLRCYLSLNSAEYHSVIVKVFADVWRDLFENAT